MHESLSLRMATYDKSVPATERWVTVQIGPFFTKNDGLIHTFTFMVTPTPKNSTAVINGAHGVLFFTEAFTSFKLSSWSNCANEAVLYASNGYFDESPPFGENIKRWHNAMYHKNEKVKIKIDTNRMKALLWNATPPKGSDDLQGLDDLDFDTEYEKYADYYFQFDLPKDIRIALGMVMGTTQQVEILKHEITYK